MSSAAGLVAVDLLPALLVVVPILAATLPLLLGLRYERVGWAIAAVVCTGLFAGAAWLSTAVYLDGERVVHELGGFQPPIGIELVADELSAMVALLVTGVTAGTLAYTRLGGPRGNTFYTGYLLLTGGLLGITLTGDVFNLFVFLEITSLATYALIARGEGPESALAAFKYLILGTVGASLYLLGVGFLFLATGSLNMVDLSTRIPEVAGYDHTLVGLAFAFTFVGFAIKVAQWPLHTWQPDAYQHAPDGVTPVIAALVSTASAYALGRIMFTVYTPDFFAAVPEAATVVVVVGSVSVLAGSSLAAIQRDVKRLFAYSSVAQFGMIVAAFGLVEETALLGAIVHLVGHGLLKAGLFAAAGVIAVGYGARTVGEYAGLAKRRPVAAATMAVLGIGLVAVPPSVTLLGKWYMALGAVEAGVWPVAAVILLSTMFTLAYVARLLEKMYFDHAAAPTVPRQTPEAATDGGETASGGVSLGMLALVVAIAVLVVALGFTGEGFAEALEPFLTEVFSSD